MLDFQPVRNKEMTMTDLVRGLSNDELRQLTNEMIDAMLDQISDCLDMDVVFVPHDPDAHDAYAANEEEIELAWTLGHVIVHVTASAEEAAAVAAELARGVRYHGRSRSEVPWQTVTTIDQCKQRLEESRRMRLASLDIWPDQPQLDNTYKYYGGNPVNAVARFAYGLKHDDDHLDQIADIVGQAKNARSK
jgi:hypothetical protein